MNLYNIKECALHETSGISFNIYISGCIEHPCEGCHMYEAWNPESGTLLVIPDLIEYMKDYGDFKFDHICILGGEPLDQTEDDLYELLHTLKTEFPQKKLWVYTHFEYEEVTKKILNELDYLKTGKYEKDLPPAKEQYGVFLVSNNQKVHKINKEEK